MRSLAILGLLAGVAHADEPALAVDLQLFADGDWLHPSSGPDQNELTLDRAEVGATVGLGRYAAAEVRLETLRSAADGGALGIAGDSLVERVKRAQIMGGYQLTELIRLDGAAGLTADPWIAVLERGDPELPLSRTASERLLGDAPSDLAFVAHATLGPVRATLAVGNGEGLSYPERNTGKNTTGVLEYRPVPALVLAAMARDGSIGVASIRNHRFGGAATLHLAIADVGIEVDHALGIAGEADITGTALAGWGEVRPIEYGVIALRGATLRLDGGARSTFGGAIAVEPTPGLRVWLAVDRTTSSGTAQPLATDPGDATTIMLIVSATRRFTWDH